MFKKKGKSVETVQPAEGESITLEGASIEVDGRVSIFEGDAPDLVEVVEQVPRYACACDHSTRASGFCTHGNNI